VRSKAGSSTPATHPRDPHAAERRLYGLSALPTHLALAGEIENLALLLQSASFVDQKVRCISVQELIDDYEMALSYGAPAGVLEEVRDALRLSAYILTENRDQTASQLTGRMLGTESPETKVFVSGLQSAEAWLRPILPSLASPGSPLQRFFRHSDAVLSVAVTGNESRVVAGSYKTRVWDSAGSIIHEWPTEGALCMEVLLPRDERTIITVNQNGLVDVRDLRSGASLGSFRVLGGVKGAAITRNGGSLVCCSDAYCLEVWKISDGSLSFRLEDPKSPKSFLSQQLAQQGMWEWDGRGHRGRINCVAVTDDDYAISGGADRQLIFWDLATGEAIKQVLCDRAIIAVTSSDRQILVALEDGSLLGYDRRTGGMAKIGVHASAKTLGASPDGHLLASGAQDGSLRLWNIRTCEEVWRPAPESRRPDMVGHGDVNRIAFSSIGGLFSASSDGFVRVWRYETAQAPWPVRGAVDTEGARYSRIHAISPDGEYMASATQVPSGMWLEFGVTRSPVT
jgi:WD40 repeat protein